MFNRDHLLLQCSITGVHDSYWTHACDVNEMNRILKEKFVELYEAPSLVCKNIEKYMRDFSWEGVEAVRRSHLVAIWEVMGCSVNHGGLEIGNIKICNRVLLAKWLWCFSLELSSL